MKTLILIFIVVAVIVGVFGVGFVCYDAAAEKRRAKKAAEEAKKQPVPQPAPVVHYIPVAAAPAPAAAYEKRQTKPLQPKTDKAAGFVAIAFPRDDGEEIKNAVFPAEWKGYRADLLRFLAGYKGIVCEKTSANEETYICNGNCVLKCFFVSGEYEKNLSETNELRKNFDCPIVNVTDAARLNAVKQSVKNALRR